MLEFVYLIEFFDYQIMDVFYMALNFSGMHEYSIFYWKTIPALRN